jgi:hypothetical protein
MLFTSDKFGGCEILDSVADALGKASTKQRVTLV